MNEAAEVTVVGKYTHHIEDFNKDGLIGFIHYDKRYDDDQLAETVESYH